MPTISPTIITLAPSASPTNGTYPPTVAPTLGECIFPRLNTIIPPDEEVDEGAFFGAR
jgi:hypothetical protein